MSKGELLLLILSLGFAGLVKGVTGLGLPLFATPILAGIFGARPAIVIMSIPVFVVNSLLVYEGRRSALSVAREIWLMTLAGVAGVLLGLWLLVRLNQSVLALIIAGVVFLFLARGDRLLGTNPHALRMRVMGLVFGGLSGLLLGGTSIAAPLLAGYFHAKRLTAREFVISVAILLQVFSTVQLVGLWRLGQYDRAILVTSLFSLVPTLLAFGVGVRVRDRLNSATFRRIITALLALAALNLILQGLRGLGVLP